MRKIRSHQSGFTLVEMLVTVIIIVILLSVSVICINKYRKQLKITELDNAAKQIYIAAQNRAILLKGSQCLEQYVIKSDNSNKMEFVEVIPNSEGSIQITAYFIHCSDENIEELLPKETIEPLLWEGDFYIVYEPESGSIMDTFYAEKDLPVDGNFRNFYDKWRAEEKVKRMENSPMIGYYGGESAESGSTISLRTPVINIYNEDTLRAEVTYWIPRLLYTMGQEEQVTIQIKLNYQGNEIILDESNAQKNDKQEGISYYTFTSTWLLDSLEEGKQFKDLFSDENIMLGDNFTIEAAVGYTGELKVNGAQKTAQDNSLFAKSSTTNTADIEYLRHLQNLDTYFSHVSSDKTNALQNKDIQAASEYEFQPINNEFLLSYDGQNYKISGLTSKLATDRPSGVFSQLYGSSEENIELKNIQLVNTTMKNASYPAAALLGEGEFVKITNCQVYWENTSEHTTNLREILGDSEKGFQYKIKSGAQAGGLAGRLSNSEVTNSFAATLIEGSTLSIGGLVGEAEHTSINQSYAASYLKGKSASGLIGSISGTNQISNSYAVGFIESLANGKAAGLCLGKGTADINNAYSAMLFTSNNQVTNYSLCETSSIYHNVYYLESDLFHFVNINPECGRSYEELTDLDKIADMFDSNVFEEKDALRTKPYNLQTTLSLSVFIYPGLKNMEHFGDWGAQFQNGSLVYFEQYDEGDGTYSYGVGGGGLDSLKDKQPIKDGYGVAYHGTEFTQGIDIILKITYQTGGILTNTESITYAASDMLKVTAENKITGKIESYYVLPLPDNIVNSSYASPDFYQKITIEKDSAQKSYYYNPHFAYFFNAILPYESTANPQELAEGLTVELRTPRHLYNLSQFDTYYASDHRYYFSQKLDLDYSIYSGYDLFQDKIGVQDPIGISFQSPFRNDYYGNSYIISGVKVNTSGTDGKYEYIGLFGYNTGVIQDVVYIMDENTKTTIIQSGSSSKTTYTGALVGYNGGSIENCAAAGVWMEADSYQYSTVYLGALVGLNQGSIERSSAEAESIMAAATMSNAYVGGFVGLNNIGGIIEQSYCVGSVGASRARYGDVVATGFAPENKGIITKSYCAMSIDTEGGAESFGFSKDATTDCVYLNDGNFAYNDKNYTAQYNDHSAKPVNWSMFTGEVESADISQLGMAYGTQVYGEPAENYPYPGVVTDQQGNNIHYGGWPKNMALGDMGIYYWEKTVLDGHESYRFSVIGVNLDSKTITKDSTLSTAHDDSVVIEEYGYGFFHTSNIKPSLISTNIGYERYLDFQYGVSKENETANENLKKLVSDEYIFHSYHTWNTDATSLGSGLYLTEQAHNGKEVPFGTWTLYSGNSVVSFKLNPFFADSMSYVKNNFNDFTCNEFVPLETPGSTDKNPYQVRSIQQLQFINWNIKNMDTVTSIENDASGNAPIQGNETEFMFLSYVNAKTSTVFQKSFYWLQTHDLYGKDVEYTPIAAFVDTVVEGGVEKSWAFGWFGGHYDGNDYTIQDLEITTSDINTTGLFGLTVDAELKNIILYSSDGKGVIQSQNEKDNWYAMGGIVGLAANTVGSNGSIQNCAVAGYNINDNNKACAFGGGGVGGLVGICNLNLEKCTAVTNIYINFEHSNSSRNVRVGGLVGSCQKTISKCYAGGEILVGNNIENLNTKVHIGGLVGGFFMKTLTITNGMVIQSNVRANNAVVTDYPSTIKECYSFVTLPSTESLNTSSKLFVIGGLGEISNASGTSLCTYKDCYYLNQVLSNNQTEENKKKIIDRNINQVCTYKDLSIGNDVFQNFVNNFNFGEITTQSSSGAAIDGRYSFGTSNYLLGQNYPFPTILTQSSDLVEGGKANVHYGDWVYPGIKRENGALPISLDLFADYKEKDGNSNCTETLFLSNLDSTGTWQKKVEDETIADAYLTPAGEGKQTLKVVAKKSGNTKVDVTYTTPDGKTYSLSIDVNISANLQVMAETLPVIVFQNETATMDLKLKDLAGVNLPDSLCANITMDEITAEYDGTMLQRADVTKENGYGLLVESLGQRGFTQVTLSYQYYYNGVTYPGSSVVSLQILEPNITLNPIIVTFGANEEKQNYTYTSKSISIQVDGSNINDISIVDFEMMSEYTEYIWAEPWPEGTTSDTVLLELNAPPVNEMAVEIRMQFRFLYGGSVHTMWQNQQIVLKK